MNNILNSSNKIEKCDKSKETVVIKRTRNDLSIEKKLQIISEVDKGDRTRTAVAKEFNIPLTTLSSLMKNRDKIENTSIEFSNRYRKRVRHAKHEELDRKLVEWFYNRRSKNLPITCSIFREKAEKLAHILRLNSFKCSNGWLQRLKERNQLTFDYIKKQQIKIEKDTTTKHSPLTEVYTIKEVISEPEINNTLYNIQYLEQDDHLNYVDEEVEEEQDEEEDFNMVDDYKNLKNQSLKILNVDPLSPSNSEQSFTILPHKNPLINMKIKTSENLPTKSEALHALNIIENVLNHTNIPVQTEDFDAMKKISEIINKTYPKYVQLKIDNFFNKK